MEGVQAAIDRYNAAPGDATCARRDELFKDWAVAVYLDDEGSPRFDIKAVDFGDPATTAWTIASRTTSSGAAATCSRAPCRRPSGATAPSAA